MDLKEFYNGNCFDAYKYLGAHFINEHKAEFITYAPSAHHVCLIGDFNNWQEDRMERIENGQFFYFLHDHVKSFQMYKYRIYYNEYDYTDHCDPYGYYSEISPGSASCLYLSDYQFHDEEWMNHRVMDKHKPINIYEIHLGTWKKEVKNYDQLGELLVPYLLENGYNYVELMPIFEYPNEKSWGYQAIGFFSPTSRYGTPDQLKSFIDYCHQYEIGVILDYIPVHFAIDSYGLRNYDGTSLYEYPERNSEWGSCNFMHSKGDVCSFLNSVAYFWIEEYHIDGLRYDAVSCLIYYQGDKKRGLNIEGISFLKSLNQGLKQRREDVLLIAEDSSSYQGITKSVSAGGLGFDYKWDLGWMNDTLDYFKKSFEERPSHYHQLTFSMYYFYNEQYLLPFSHDETVHGKKTIIDKIYGSYKQKFSQLKALYLYMYTHPGKKLNFMGNELGQFREWDENRQQDWILLDYPIHQEFSSYMKSLCHLYLTHFSLFQEDYDYKGFRWIDCHQEDRCLYIYKRICEKETLVCFFNFSLNDSYYQYTGEHDLELLISSENNYKEKKISVGKQKEIFIPKLSGLCFQEKKIG